LFDGDLLRVAGVVVSWGGNRLACCQPTAYDGASQTIVHSLFCTYAPETPLTKEEWNLTQEQGRELAQEFNRKAEKNAMLRARLDAARAVHPAGKNRRPRIVNCTCAHPMQGCGMHKGEL
jgi:hypothetical protein